VPQRGTAVQLRIPGQSIFHTPDAQGFKTHHDTHDVFVLQISGSKQWRTYEPVVRLPPPGQRFYWQTPPDGPAANTLTLRPGDLFYCPRGVPHDARAGKQASLHISLGALVTTWTELLLEIVADVALRDAAFRAGLPARFATNNIEPAVLNKTLRDLLAQTSCAGSAETCARGHGGSVHS
jgi:ribosomal protein L16 Arg81 hydroxylase